MSFKAFAKKLWTRQRPDGKPAAGAARYLLFGGLLAVFVVWTVNRMAVSSTASRVEAFTGAPSKKEDNPITKSVQIQEVAEAAMETRSPRLEGPETEALGTGSRGAQVSVRDENFSSFFSAEPPPAENKQGTGTGETFSIFERLSQPEVRTPKVSQGEQQQTQGVEDEFRLESRGTVFIEPSVGQGGATANAQLPPIGDLFAANSSPNHSTSAPGGQSSQTAAPRSKIWLPRGENIPVFLMTRVQTGLESPVVEFAVARTVWFNGRPVLPFGTRFQGQMDTKGTRDRITFKVDAIRRRDGVEIPAPGIVLGQDKFTGVVAYYVPPTTLQQLAPYVGSFTTTFADVLKETVIAQAGAGIVTVAGEADVTTQTRSLKESVSEAAAVASAKALSDFISKQVGEIQERNAPYLYLPEGWLCYVQLSSAVDLAGLWTNEVESRNYPGTPVGMTKPVSVIPSSQVQPTAPAAGLPILE